jgi:hypothetical protein
MDAPDRRVRGEATPVGAHDAPAEAPPTTSAAAARRAQRLAHPRLARELRTLRAMVELY